jgi:hypothetical protein
MFSHIRYKVKRHKLRAKELLTPTGELSYEVESILMAIRAAQDNWDDLLVAFYVLELHAAVEELVYGRDKEEE